MADEKDHGAVRKFERSVTDPQLVPRLKKPKDWIVVVEREHTLEVSPTNMATSAGCESAPMMVSAGNTLYTSRPKLVSA